MTSDPDTTWAARPAELQRRHWISAAKDVWTGISRDRLSLIAAGIAFFGLLALFPAITALMAIAGLFLTPGDVTAQIQQISAMMPPSAADIVIEQAKSVAGSDQGGLGLAAALGVIIALYSASAGVSNLIAGLNVCYGVRESRNFIKLKAVTMVMTLLLIVAFLMSLSVVLVLPGVLSLLQLGATVEITVSILRWILLLGFTVTGIALIYHFGPDRRPARWRWVTPGALIACLLWIVASFGFSLYAENFGSYQETFGSLAGVVLLLFWLWISAFIVLLGARINAALEDQTRAPTQQAD
ncbi:YihY/virulence factor BrkB family protein [Salipiger sp. 1_MG-2023]|uniref:YihY/virulence factor BrkB family protein n=1 Tax=Salipiger sp. 1_MG-2023 TaxID=3062665 RepID=UPI0026E20B85|nr:YihY/virulence factor BrkB family protein [Salipiger sp. 1_MG-2023]MDO6587220.1 YihY/virulence factor BrkB family protein [Salipiger sp. 1_MG-2023]